MEIDLRFVEIDYEVWAIGQYLDIIERNMPVMSDGERRRILSQLRLARTGLPDYDLAHAQADHIETDVLPRYLRGSFIVALWAIFEAAVTSLAKHVQATKKISLSLSDIRGDFLERSRKYFDHVAQFSLIPDRKKVESLQMVESVRHVVAHANSRLDAASAQARQHLTGLLLADVGLREDDGFLMIDERFARDSYRLVEELLNDLVSRARAALD